MEVLGTVILVVAFLGFIGYKVYESRKPRPYSGTGGGGNPEEPIVREDLR